MDLIDPASINYPENSYQKFTHERLSHRRGDSLLTPDDVKRIENARERRIRRSKEKKGLQ